MENSPGRKMFARGRMSNPASRTRFQDFEATRRVALDTP